MRKLKATVTEQPEGFARFTAILSITTEGDPFEEVLWNEKFQGPTQAEGAVKLAAKKWLKANKITKPTIVFEKEWEL